MSQISDYLEAKLQDLSFNQVAFTGPATYIALYTAAPSDAGGGTEVTGGSYARQVVNPNSGLTPKWKLAAASGGGSLVENLNDITFPTATASWGEILAFGILDALTVGNLLWWDFLAPAVAANFPFTAAAATDTFTAYGHTLANNDRVILRGSQLPTGVSADTIYYVISVAANTFQLSLTQGGAAINLTADGGGEVRKINPKPVQTNDTFKFPAAELDCTLF